ncbi:MAG: glycosyltransferase [Deltaproteobacteria bacterium]|nr:glycosyltransferase [Deltaproteobacteria bacterium]
MSKKRICVLDTGKEWGGGTNSLMELLKRADKKRYSFTALFYENYGMGDGPDVGSEIERLGVEFIHMKKSPVKLYAKGLKEAGRALFFFSRVLRKKYVFNIDRFSRIIPDSERIAWVLKDGGFDLLYLNNQPSSNLEGILAAASTGVPCVQHSRIEVRLKPLEARLVNESVSRVICVSEGVRRGLVESGVRADKCVVVYNGIDPSVMPGRKAELVRRELGLHADSVLIGTVGSLVERKRVNLLIEATARLKKTGDREVYCVIVGDGPEKGRLRKEAERLGAGDRVIFTGFSADALSYMNAMDIFVTASRAEGLPRVILEAMLTSKPVIAFDIVGANELVADGVTGLLLKDGGGKAIANAVKGIVGHGNKIKAFGSAGRRRVVESFGIERYVKGVEKVFEEVFSCST